jgi:hypothetical protein
MSFWCKYCVTKHRDSLICSLQTWHGVRFLSMALQNKYVLLSRTYLVHIWLMFNLLHVFVLVILLFSHIQLDFDYKIHRCFRAIVKFCAKSLLQLILTYILYMLLLVQGLLYWDHLRDPVSLKESKNHTMINNNASSSMLYFTLLLYPVWGWKNLPVL